MTFVRLTIRFVKLEVESWRLTMCFHRLTVRKTDPLSRSSTDESRNIPRDGP